MAASIVRLEGEQQVNIYAEGNQSTPVITSFSDGSWVVTWASQGQGELDGRIYQRRFNRDGTPKDEDDVQVNTERADDQLNPSVTVLKDGNGNDAGWVLTWTSYISGSSEFVIYQQRYDIDGRVPRGEDGEPLKEQRVNTTPHFDQPLPKVTGLANGGWVVTWTSYGRDDSGYDIYQQRYDADGSPRGEQLVNTFTDSDQTSPSVTALRDGGWVVTWTSYGQDGSEYGIYQQRYDAGGQPRGDEELVNGYTRDQQRTSSVTALADGGWVVTWESYGRDGDGWGIYQQRYGSGGNRVGGEQKINTQSDYATGTPSVTAFKGGGWIVTWTSHGQDGDGGGIYQQRYDSAGTPVGSEQRVNTYWESDQVNPSVATFENGWVVTWSSNGQDGSAEGIYQQRFTPVGAFGAGREAGIGSAGDDLFDVTNGGLTAGDSVEGGLGTDILRLIHAGTMDLTAPKVLTDIEIVQGSEGNDIIVLNSQRLTGVRGLQTPLLGIRGGAGTDELRLKKGDYLLDRVFISGIEKISLTGEDSRAYTSDKATALLLSTDSATASVKLEEGGVFTLAERQQLYNQGFRSIYDGNGAHVLRSMDPSLSKASVQENAGTGTVVGDLSAVDPNPRDGLRFELIDTAGGRFALSGNKIVVAAGAPLDRETAASHTIRVRVTDDGGIASEKAFTITVDDIPVEEIRGTAGADMLSGGSSRDVLYGGLGKDTLTGGAGEDIFVFDTKPNKKTNLDTIGDFSVKDDGIWLDNAVFTKLGKAGSAAAPAALKSSSFVSGSKAKDKNDYVIYDKAKGVLLYDADGSGKGKAVEIATLSKGLALTASDFFVI